MRVSAGVKAGRNTEMMQFEKKISKENKNDARELGLVIIALYKKNIYYFRVFVINKLKEERLLSKFPECKRMIL